MPDGFSFEEASAPADHYERNSAWTRPGPRNFYTSLPPAEETRFQEWVKANKVPFDPGPKADYDMRGFWKALEAGDPKAKSAIDPNDNQLHYPDYWKTPHHETFSRQSQWATDKAPDWDKQDRLVGQDGKVLFDPKARPEQSSGEGFSFEDALKPETAAKSNDIFDQAKKVGGGIVRGLSALGDAPGKYLERQYEDVSTGFADKPGYTYGSVLPFRKNEKTGEVEWGYSQEALRAAVRGAGHVFDFDINNPRHRAEVAAVAAATMGLNRGPGMIVAPRPGAPPPRVEPTLPGEPPAPRGPTLDEAGITPAPEPGGGPRPGSASLDEAGITPTREPAPPEPAVETETVAVPQADGTVQQVQVKTGEPPPPTEPPAPKDFTKLSDGDFRALFSKLSDDQFEALFAKAVRDVPASPFATWLGRMRSAMFGMVGANASQAQQPATLEEAGLPSPTPEAQGLAAQPEPGAASEAWTPVADAPVEQPTAETPVAAQEPPAPPLDTAHGGPWVRVKTKAGENASNPEGDEVYENPNGVRATFEDGVPYTEPTTEHPEKGLVPRNAKGRPERFLTAEETGLGAVPPKKRDEPKKAAEPPTEAKPAKADTIPAKGGTTEIPEKRGGIPESTTKAPTVAEKPPAAKAEAPAPKSDETPAKAEAKSEASAESTPAEKPTEAVKADGPRPTGGVTAFEATLAGTPEHPGIRLKNLRDGKETVIQPPGTVAPSPEEPKAANRPETELPALPTAHETVTHTTRKGKVLTGTIRKDLTLDEAKALDPYAFRRDGGFFIRTKSDEPERPKTIRTIAEIQDQEKVSANRAKKIQDDEILALGRPIEPVRYDPPEATKTNPTAPPASSDSAVQSLDPDTIGVDAPRFQFKAGGDESGVTERLQGVEKWDPYLAGTALVWRDLEGDHWIADGHQRLGLAQRLKAEGQPDIKINAFVLDESAGITDADARQIAAAKNIAEGTGTAIDAAKVMREASAAGRALPPLPPRSTLVRDGQAIARLGDDAFGMAVNEVIPVQHAAIVGRLISDPMEQAEAMRVLARTKPETARQAEMVVRDVIEAGTERMTQQGGLFGDETFASSAVLERAKVADEAMRQLARDRTTFRTLVGEAERIQGHGENVLDTDANRSRLTGDEQARQLLTQLATRKGPVSDALTGIARRVKSGEVTIAGGAREFLGVVRHNVSGQLDQGTTSGGAVSGSEARDQDLASEDQLPGELLESSVPLFSPVQRAVDGLKQAKGTGEQMLAQIAKTPGVKPEELKWMGLPNWLNGQKSVTREQIADYVRANQLDVREVERGGKPDIQQTQNAANAAEAALRESLPSVVTMLDGTTMTADQVVSGVARNTFTIRSLPPEFRALSYKFGDALDEMNGAMSGERSDTKYSSYTLPGGENYRELLITLPPKAPTALPNRPQTVTTLPEGYDLSIDKTRPASEQWAVIPPGQWHGRPFAGYHGSERAATQFALNRINDMAEQNWLTALDEARASQGYKSAHWDEPNILAHIRFNERTASDGKRVLFVEEAQSDWHQAGRKGGYKLPEEEYQRLSAREQELIGRGQDATPAEKQEWADIRNRLQAQSVPDAPFKTSWPSLVMKRVLKYAVDNGFDRVAWAPGEVHADRYDLSKQVDRITYVPSTQELHAFKNNRNVLSEKVPHEKLPDYIGKDAADKLINAPDQEGHDAAKTPFKRLEGDDLRAGGAGMRGFYDKILPAETQKIVWKYGAKVGKSEIPVLGRDERTWRRNTSDRLLEAAEHAEQDGATPAIVRMLTGAAEKIDAPETDANAIMRGLPHIAQQYVHRAGGWPDFQQPGKQDVHSVDITPAMRAAIQSDGLGLFAGRRLPPPPKTGTDLFGDERAAPSQRTSEPTIRTDQRQQTMPGMEPSAVQAQAARDQSGRGGLMPSTPQAKANEGLFARAETPQPELLADRPRMSDAAWQALLAKGKAQKDLAAVYADRGDPMRFGKDGWVSLVSKDLNYPPDGWRVTSFDTDGQPTGHLEFKTPHEAFLYAVQRGEPITRTSRWSKTSGDGFKDQLHEIAAASHEAAANWVFDRGRETGHEHIAVVDNRTGEIIHGGTNGHVNRVGFRGDNGAADTDAYTVHHNHPNNTALSDADIGMLANPGVSHVVAHGHDGTTTVASLSPAFASKRHADTLEITRNGTALVKAYRNALPLSESILRKLVRDGSIDYPVADRLFHDVANRLLQAQGVIDYSSTVEIPPIVTAELAKTLERLGHAANTHDRYTVAVRPEDRIAGLPRPDGRGARQGFTGGSAGDNSGEGVSRATPRQTEREMKAIN